MQTIHYRDIPKLVGQEVVSDWLLVDQARIDRFAEATGDHQWIHVDVERAKREIGGTIAHGFLTLSLVPVLMAASLKVEGVSKGINYGCNKLRFTEPVPAGTRIRLQHKLLSAEPKSGGYLMTRECKIEIEGKTRPALIAELLGMAFG